MSPSSRFVKRVGGVVWAVLRVVGVVFLIAYAVLLAAAADVELSMRKGR